MKKEKETKLLFEATENNLKVEACGGTMDLFQLGTHVIRSIFNDFVNRLEAPASMKRAIRKTFLSTAIEASGIDIDKFVDQHKATTGLAHKLAEMFGCEDETEEEPEEEIKEEPKKEEKPSNDVDKLLSKFEEFKKSLLDSMFN